MGDYSFMRSGPDLSDRGALSLDQLEEINILVSLFLTKGLKNAARYIKLCNRNVITKMDISMGMKCEMLTFLNHPSLQEEFDKHKEEYFNEIYNEENNEESNFALENHITSQELEDEIIAWRKLTTVEILKCNDSDKEFVRKMHNMTEHWNTWTPSNPFEKILQNNIIKFL